MARVAQPLAGHPQRGVRGAGARLGLRAAARPSAPALRRARRARRAGLRGSQRHDAAQGRGGRPDRRAVRRCPAAARGEHDRLSTANGSAERTPTRPASNGSSGSTRARPVGTARVDLRRGRGGPGVRARARAQRASPRSRSRRAKPARVADVSAAVEGLGADRPRPWRSMTPPSVHADLIVNATPLGARQETLPVPPLGPGIAGRRPPVSPVRDPAPGPGARRRAPRRSGGSASCCIRRRCRSRSGPASSRRSRSCRRPRSPPSPTGTDPGSAGCRSIRAGCSSVRHGPTM